MHTGCLTACYDVTIEAENFSAEEHSFCLCNCVILYDVDSQALSMLLITSMNQEVVEQTC